MRLQMLPRADRAPIRQAGCCWLCLSPHLVAHPTPLVLRLPARPGIKAGVLISAQCAAFVPTPPPTCLAQVKAEQAASLASLVRKLEAAKGAEWAVQFQADLKNVAWFDSAVAANPAVGPKATA